MSSDYDSKVLQLAAALRDGQLVVFNGSEEAQTLIDGHKLPMKHPQHQNTVEEMAEELYKRRNKNHVRIGELLAPIGTHRGCKLSALREAILICARQVVDLAEMEIPVGVFDEDYGRLAKV